MPSATDAVDLPGDSFSVDAVARNVCSTWEEAITNPAFDIVVIAAGCLAGIVPTNFPGYKREAVAHTPARGWPVPLRRALSRSARHRIERAGAYRSHQRRRIAEGICLGDAVARKIPVLWGPLTAWAANPFTGRAGALG